MKKEDIADITEIKVLGFTVRTFRIALIPV